MKDNDIENIVFNAMKECGELADKLKAEGKDADYIMIYSKGYFQGEYDTKQKINEEIETYKKVAEKLAEKLTYERGRKQDYMFCIDICEENWCDNKNCNQCMENIIEWARKEVEKDDR